MYTAVSKMGNQQGPTIEHRVMWQPGGEGGLGETGYMYNIYNIGYMYNICMMESLFCPPETIMTL